MFSVSAADLNAAAGIVIDLSQPDATALINIVSAAQLTITPQYMNLSGSATAQRLVWNLPNATALAVTHGVSWKGLILAPNATVTSDNRPQLSGQLIANTVPTSDWVLSYVPFTGCLPPVTGSPDLSSTASASVPAGQLVHDTAHLTGGSDPTGAISFRVYGPANRGCRLPLAGFSVVRVTSGNGDYRSASFRPRAAGVYRWVVTYSGDRANRPAGPTACTAAGEKVVVSRAQTALSTDASPGAGLGGEIHDTATLAVGRCQQLRGGAGSLRNSRRERARHDPPPSCHSRPPPRRR